MAVELKDVVAQLKTNNKSQDITNKAMLDFINMAKQSRLDDLENKKEAKKAPVQKLSAFQKGKQDATLRRDFMAPMLGLNIAKMILPLTAGLAAVGAAFVGIRGWEVKALKKLSKLPKLAGSLLIKPFTALRTRVLAMFGFAADGSKIPIRGADGKFMSGAGRRDLFKKLTTRINKVLGPVKAISDGIGSWISKAGAPLMKFLAPFLGAAGKFSALFTKILWPVSVVMSLFKGVSAFMDTEGTFWEKTQAGIVATIKDFIGAPLGLLADLVAWALGKFGFTDAAQAVTDFDIQAKVGDLVAGILSFPTDAIAWIKEKFNFDDGVFTGLWRGMIATQGAAFGGAEKLLDFLMWPAKKAVEWIMGKFGWEVPEGFTLNPLTHIRLFAADAWLWIMDKFAWASDLVSDVLADPMGTMKSWATSAGTWVADKFGFSLSDLASFDIIGFVTGWVTDLGTSIANMLPDVSAIGQMFKDKLYSILPNWAKSAIDGMEVTNSTPYRPVMSDDLLRRLAAENVAMGQSVVSKDASGRSVSLISPNELENLRINFNREIARLSGELRPNANTGPPTIVFSGAIDQSQNSSGTVVNAAPPLLSVDQSNYSHYMSNRNWSAQ